MVYLTGRNETNFDRRLDGLGMGFPSDTRCAEHDRSRDRREPGRRDWLFPLGQGCSRSRPL